MGGNRFRLAGRVALQFAVTAAQRDQMYRLLVRQTPGGVTHAAFVDAMSESQWVAMIWGQESRQICGFAALAARRGRVAGEVLTAFSLPVMAVDEVFAGPVALARLLLQHALRAAHNSPGGRFFWVADHTGSGIDRLHRALLLHPAEPDEQARLAWLTRTGLPVACSEVRLLNLTPIARHLLGYLSSPAARPENGRLRTRQI